MCSIADAWQSIHIRLWQGVFVNEVFSIMLLQIFHLVQHFGTSPIYNTISHLYALISYLSLTDMIPNGLVTDKQSTDEPSLYLCLKIGQPINKSVSADCPIELYSKKKRPEYWFTVPRDK